MLIIDERIFDDLPANARHELLRHAIDSLPDETRARIWDLAAVWGGDGVEDRVRTNAFGAKFGMEEGGRWGVVVLEAAVCLPFSHFDSLYAMK